MTAGTHYPVTLDKRTVAVALFRLGTRNGAAASTLYTRLMGSWGSRIDRERVTLKLTTDELATFRELELPSSLVECPRYVAVYRDPRDLKNNDRRIVTYTQDIPPKRRAFAGVGGRRRKLVRVRAARIIRRTDNQLNTGDTATMARKSNAKSSATTVTRKKKGSTAKAKPVEDEVDEELAGLEELDELEELEEPAAEADDEEDEDGEDLTKLTVKQLRAKAKEAGVTGTGRMSKAQAIEAINAADDEEDEEEEDDEDDGLDEMDRKELKAKLRELEPDASIKKSESDDDLRERIRALDEDEEDDDEEEDEPAPKKSSAKSAKSTGKKGGAKNGTPPPTRALPNGKVGVERIAELAKSDGRAVRVFLRKLDGSDKYKVDGRWAFTEKQATAIAKRVKSAA